ncbi:hypothetical protein SAMN04488071_0915 [Kordiimonas lacus]|jgi:hypothetical protein|uniref:Uncharacterized protein n=1 Tax=Kordiimonas lacus TaxID=637679 RepID=A0A1G6W1S3_9PROT|nr:hypothetical protein SAMN04488071_0915 [Kordiimonas lacus]
MHVLPTEVAQAGKKSLPSGATIFPLFRVISLRLFHGLLTMYK